MANSSARIVFIFGAAAMAGVLAGESTDAQSGFFGLGGISTPRLADGKPDLNGIWIDTTITDGFGSNNGGPILAGRGNTFLGVDADGGLWRMAGNTTTIPQYKPQFWDTIIENEQTGNWTDRVVKCLPIGVPASGA